MHPLKIFQTDVQWIHPLVFIRKSQRYKNKYSVKLSCPKASPKKKKITKEILREKKRYFGLD